MAGTSSGFENNKGELKNNRRRLKIINGQRLTRFIYQLFKAFQKEFPWFEWKMYFL